MGIEKVIMLSIAICDDEPFCLDKENSIISNYLNECKEEFKVDVFTSPASLLSAVSSNEYDLVMLDVEMPDIDGIEVAHKVHEINDKTQIAFISAYMKYASRGYHVNAFRYILKDEDMEVYIRECLDPILDQCDETCQLVLVDDGLSLAGHGIGSIGILVECGDGEVTHEHHGLLRQPVFGENALVEPREDSVKPSTFAFVKRCHGRSFA